MVRRNDGVCTSINFNFRTWYEVEITFSDNPKKKETIHVIILAQENQVLIYRLDIIFSKSQVAQLMVSQIIFFCQREFSSANSNFKPCQEVEKW